MAVSYEKLFNLMRDKKMKRKDLIERAGISYATIAKLKKAITSKWRFWRRFVVSLSAS